MNFDTQQHPVLSEALTAIYNARYANTAAAVVIIYDHLITLDQEINLIWGAKSRVKPGIVLFVINRYYELFAAIFNTYALFAPQPSRTFCTFWYRWQGWTNVCISAALTEIILILRLRALYANDSRVTVVVVVCFILTTCASALIMGFALSSGHGFTVDVIEWEGHLYCIGTNIPKFLPAYFGPIFAFEALLGGLAAYKWIRDTSGANRGMVIPALMKTLVRDSCVYFIWMTTMYSVTATIWACVPTMLEVPAGILNASGCVLGNRLILNLRSRHSIHVDRPSPESSTLLSLPDLSTTGSGDTTLVSEPEEMENKIAVPRPTPALSCSARASPSSTTLSPPLRQRSATGTDRTTVGSPV